LGQERKISHPPKKGKEKVVCDAPSPRGGKKKKEQALSLKRNEGTPVKREGSGTSAKEKSGICNIGQKTPP